jgi:hypothetical protein
MTVSLIRRTDPSATARSGTAHYIPPLHAGDRVDGGGFRFVGPPNPRISRALYVTATGKRVVIVRVFVKKTQKTPSREIDLALSRAKEVLP